MEKADTECVQKDSFVTQRKNLVKNHIKPLGLGEKINKAFLTIPREEFVPDNYKTAAYEDKALPIGRDQTISQPSLVALMTSLLALKGKEKVLEVGTGSGYQAAILSKLAKEVYTVERVTELAVRANKVLKSLKIKNTYVHTADRGMGLPKFAPFDAIMVTAGATEIPQTLVDQLKEAGTMVIPVGPLFETQKLLAGVKVKGKLLTREIEDVRFVPLISGQEGNA